MPPATERPPPQSTAALNFPASPAQTRVVLQAYGLTVTHLPKPDPTEILEALGHGKKILATVSINNGLSAHAVVLQALGPKIPRRTQTPIQSIIVSDPWYGSTPLRSLDFLSRRLHLRDVLVVE